MARRYLVKPLPPPGAHPLPDEVAHHVGRVMRARPGDLLRLFDGEGRECEAEILSADKRRVEVEVGPTIEVEREPRLQVELAVALPKGARADWLFEHGTEVGIAAFRPILTERSQRGTSGARSERWERIVTAAATQCDRSRLPPIHPLLSLDELLALPDLPAERAVLAPGSDTELAAGRAARSLILIGPEGGLSDRELEQLDTHDFGRRGLGALTLRVETAALVAAARLLAPLHDS